MSDANSGHQPTGESVIVVQYGEPKMGKDTDCVGSFPGGLFLGPKNAFKGGESLWGYTVAKAVCPSLSDVNRILREGIKSGSLTKYTAVIVSDLSILSETRVEDIKYEEQANPSGRSGKPDNFRPWVETMGAVNQLLARNGRALPCHLIVNTHSTEPVEEEGKKKPKTGGISMSHAKAAKGVLRHCDAVLHLEAAATLEGNEYPVDSFGGKRPWPFLYRCGRDDQFYISGSRIAGIPSLAPMSLGEIFRRAGLYAPMKYPWMEALVERGAKALLAGKPRADVIKKIAALAQTQASVLNGSARGAVMLTLRETIARAELEVLQTSVEEAYGLEV